MAARRGIPSIRTHSINDPDYVARVRELAPDVIVSVAAPEKFRREILCAHRVRCVKVHSGRLPKYRGILLEGEAHATVTVHEMVEELDVFRAKRHRML